MYAISIRDHLLPVERWVDVTVRLFAVFNRTLFLSDYSDHSIIQHNSKQLNTFYSLDGAFAPRGRKGKNDQTASICGIGVFSFM